MPKNLSIEDIKPKGFSVVDIKPQATDLGNISAFVWGGGTTTYRNHSLYRNNDLYRGGKSSSSNAGETTIKPKMYSVENL